MILKTIVLVCICSVTSGTTFSYELITDSKIISISTNKQKYLSASSSDKVRTDLLPKLIGEGCLRGDKYLSEIESIGSKYQVDIDLIRAVIAIESCFDSNAVSSKGAQGLMQLMPATAKRFGVVDSFDVKQNIEGGVRYLRFLLKRFADNETLALAAYNAGEGAVDFYDGVPPYEETHSYLEKIFLLYGKKNNFQFSIKPVNLKSDKCVAPRKLRIYTSLIISNKYLRRYYSPNVGDSFLTVSKATGVSLDTVKQFNKRGGSQQYLTSSSRWLLWECQIKH